MKPKNLKGLTLQELSDFALSIGEPRFRGKQLFDWLYTKEAGSFEEMSSLAKPLRARLGTIAAIGAMKLVDSQESKKDGTTKFLFELEDGKRIESVLIPPKTAFDDPNDSPDAQDQKKRLTLCVSTQVGCALDCKFCATASMGILRNLSTGEIVDQVMQVKCLTGKTITNLVYMGMGEPLMNYDNVMDSVEIISTGLKIAARRITISTAGWIPKIRQMADEDRKAKLAISLHTLDDAKRSELMPINRKYPLDDLLDAAAYYYRKTRQRITFEYILFDGWNDQPSDAARLVKLSKQIPCKVNIIPFHSIEFTHPTGISAKLHPTPARKAHEFIEELRSNKMTVFIRSSAGEDIDAACGQLAVRHESGVLSKRIPSGPRKIKAIQTA